MSDSNILSPMTIKTSPAERSRIKRDAREAGMTISSYVRSKLLAEPETKTVFKASQTRRLMKDMIGQIGRVGNNMNQIAFKLNSGLTLNSLDASAHAEGIEALKQMRAVLVNHLLTPKGPC